MYIFPRYSLYIPYIFPIYSLSQDPPGGPGAGGRGWARGALKILQDLQQVFSTPGSPYGGAADLKATALPPAPLCWPLKGICIGDLYRGFVCYAVFGRF